MKSQEQVDRRGELVVGLRNKRFNAERTFENAQGVFLACRQYGIEIPEPVLAVITEVFKKDYDKHIIKLQERIKKFLEKEIDKQQIICCFILFPNQGEAAKFFLKSNGINNPDDAEIKAVRTTAERYLREIYPEDKDQPLSKLLARYRQDITE